ncbi:MAG TPA: YggT family protein [Gammaproteobacteria bacterium]|nr:YggT family protein [Gammaproteobacteria bacterium]
MNGYLANPLIFLIDFTVGLYILAVMLRFLLQWVHADFYNPLSQFIVRITNPLLIPLRRLIPGFGGVDWASVVLLLLLITLKMELISAVQGRLLPPVSLAPLVLAELLNTFLNIFFFTILIQAIASWIAPHQYNPVTGLLHQLNEPLLRPIRRLLPPMGGLDFSPLLALALIHLSRMLLLQPLYNLAL